MNRLEDLIEKEIEKRLDVIITTKIFPEFLKIAKHSVQKNYYDLYKPIQYKRRFRLKDKWVLKKNGKNYEIYINEDIKGKWANNTYYLPQLILEGKVARKEKDKITYTPRPFISDLKTDLDKNKTFNNLLSKYGLNIR